MIRTLIVDDEEIGRQAVRILLRKDADIEVVGESYGARAVDDIVALHPDLVFLDVMMPGMDGFEVLAALPADAIPLVVFVTAYDEFATKAFERHAVDYLMKPYSTKRFVEAVGRAKQILSTRRRLAEHHELLARFSADLAGERIVIRDGGRKVVYSPQDILYVRAAGVYVRVRSTRGLQLARDNISAVEQRLDPATFVRVHRSVIVNVKHVAELRARRHGDGEVVMKDAQVLPVSRTRRGELERRLAR